MNEEEEFIDQILENMNREGEETESEEIPNESEKDDTRDKSEETEPEETPNGSEKDDTRDKVEEPVMPVEDIEDEILDTKKIDKSKREIGSLQKKLQVMRDKLRIKPPKTVIGKKLAVAKLNRLLNMIDRRIYDNNLRLLSKQKIMQTKEEYYRIQRKLLERIKELNDEYEGTVYKEAELETKVARMKANKGSAHSAASPIKQEGSKEVKDKDESVHSESSPIEQEESKDESVHSESSPIEQEESKDESAHSESSPIEQEESKEENAHSAVSPIGQEGSKEVKSKDENTHSKPSSIEQEESKDGKYKGELKDINNQQLRVLEHRLKMIRERQQAIEREIKALDDAYRRNTIIYIDNVQEIHEDLKTDLATVETGLAKENPGIFSSISNFFKSKIQQFKNWRAERKTKADEDFQTVINKAGEERQPFLKDIDGGISEEDQRRVAEEFQKRFGTQTQGERSKSEKDEEESDLNPEEEETR